MREVVLDTETTGLNRGNDGAVSDGHRVIEIGCVELVDGRITGRRFQTYLNPGRVVDDRAVKIHGITTEFLRGKPQFSDVVAEFLDFIRGADLIIHNAPFDVAFLDQEFTLLEKRLRPVGVFRVFDTLALARNMFPYRRNSLDALADFFQVGLHRAGLHGALLDAEILARVYIQLRQFG